MLSVAAAWGFITLIWQNGHGSEEIWGIAATGSIAAWIPLMIFAFLYGLSMDYEVFILARIREEYDNTKDTDEAVVFGLGRTGRLVTSAALILFLAFASMASSPGTDTKVMATGLAAGILIDATLIRALLVPAVVSLFGRWNWWLPEPHGAAPARACLNRGMRRVWLAVLVLLVVGVQPAAAAETKYSIVHGCFQVQGAEGGPFRMQATTLAEYLLYSKDEKFLAADGSLAEAPSEATEWRASEKGGGIELTPKAGGTALTLGAKAEGCAAYPEVEVNATGTPGRSRPYETSRASWTATCTGWPSSSSAARRTAAGRGTSTALPTRSRTVRTTRPATAAAPSSRTSCTATPPAATTRCGWPTFKDWPRPAVADARELLLPLGGARLARRPADLGQPAGGEQGALRPLPAEAERLQRDGQRAAAVAAT